MKTKKIISKTSFLNTGLIQKGLKIFYAFFVIFSFMLSQSHAQVNIITIDAGYGHSLAVGDNGNIWTWGFNDYGQLGDGTTMNRNRPVYISGGGKDVAGGSHHSLAVKADGMVWAWGNNFNGQLGDGTTIMKTIPIQVSGLTDVIAVAAGSSHSLALKDDGTVWAWGYNGRGQLGDGTTINRHTPVQIVGPGGTGFLTDIIAISAGWMYSMALKSDGTVWAWGSNSYGELGDGTNTPRYTPVQVIGLTDIIAINSKGFGNYHSMALKSDGTVWTWGLNNFGQLGDGTTINKKLPIQVGGGLTDVIAISAGFYHSLAVKSDGSLWGWGRNMNGQLGDGTSNNRLFPVQSIGVTGTMITTGGGSHSIILKDDSSICAVGLNWWGQIGDGTNIYNRKIYTCNIFLSVTASKKNVSCYGENDGSINLTVTGGMPPYTFSWSNGATTEDISNLIPDIYTVTVTDAYTSITLSVTITEPPTALTASMSGINASCNGCSDGQAIVYISGGTTTYYDYIWSNGVFNTAVPDTSNTITGLSAGTYSVTVTESVPYGCSTHDSIIITEPPVMTTSMSGINVSCNGGSDGQATVNIIGGSPNYFYGWSNGVYSSNDPNTSHTIAGLSAGTYSVTIMDANGFTVFDEITVTEPAVLIADAGNNITICSGENTDIGGSPTASGGTPPYSYSWSPATGLSSTTIANPTATPALTTTYTITVLDANGCTETDSTTIYVNPNPIVDAGYCQTVYYGYAPEECTNLFAAVSDGTPPYTFLWSTGETTQDITVCPSVATTFTVVVTDVNGCSGTDVVTVEVVDVRCGKNLNKVQVCHFPPGNPGNAQDLCISPNAVPDHLTNHGDRLGLCDAGDPCFQAKMGEIEDEDIMMNEFVDKNIIAEKIQQEMILQAYPNPFSDFTTIKFSLPTIESVFLSVYNISGKQIAVLFDNVAERDKVYNLEFNASDLSSGVYYYRLITENGIYTEKLIILK
ncbi:MAG: T9SS type A sorting domain-containing protein [Bacteroidota bacterium]